MTHPHPAFMGYIPGEGLYATNRYVGTARKHLIGDDLSKGIIYMSDQTHHCVIKVASMAGIPEKNIRLLGVDKNYRAIPEYFESAIKEDLRKGLKPFLLVGNAGTTNTGAVDPLTEL